MRAALLGSLIFLTGCVTNPPVIKTVDRIVEVPVPVPCKIRPVERPIMPLDTLMAGDDILSMTKKAIVEIEKRIVYEMELEAAIKECQ